MDPKVVGSMNENKQYETHLTEYCQKLQTENEILKDILSGSLLTVDIGQTNKQVLFSDLFIRHSLPNGQQNLSSTASTQKGSQTAVKEVEETVKSAKASGNNPAIEENANTDQAAPKFYKEDLLAILQEKNELKEERDNLVEELTEWKRAAMESQKSVNTLESELSIALAKLGNYAYATEVEANALGVLPRGLDFRPSARKEAMDVYVIDVEGVSYTERNGKFVFAIQLTWSDKRRFEIYRGYSEFFTFQNTLLLLFPEEAGKHKSERIIPSLPTADNVLAILGATSKKSIVESRLQLVTDYCTTILMELPKKVSHSTYVKDFFQAKPGDYQLDSLARPRRHSLELSVYPLHPEGKPLGIYVAVADFTPSKDAKNQISMKAGQSYKVVKKEDSGWWFVYADDGEGECGFVPASFLKLIGDRDITSPVETREILGFVGSLRPETLDLGTNSHTAKTEAHPFKTQTQTDSDETETDTSKPTILDSQTFEIEVPVNIDSIFKHVATEAYRTSESNQLSFPQGAILSIIEKCEDGWWFATYNNEGGWVPSTYLVPYSELESLADADEFPSLPPTSLSGQSYTTVQNYTAADEDELSIPMGVRVEVTEKSLTGWWRVKYKRKEGYVPAVILKPFNELDNVEESLSPLQASLGHSMSGIKSPPPRRTKSKAFLQTLEEVIEEVNKEEHLQAPEGGEKENRRQSFMNWISNLRSGSRRKSTDQRPVMQVEETKARSSSGGEKDSSASSSAFKVAKLTAEPRLRSCHISGETNGI